MSGKVVKMCNLKFEVSLFKTFESGTVIDRLFSSYNGLPKGVHYAYR